MSDKKPTPLEWRIVDEETLSAASRVWHDDGSAMDYTVVESAAGWLPHLDGERCCNGITVPLPLGDAIRAVEIEDQSAYDQFVKDSQDA